MVDEIIEKAEQIYNYLNIPCEVKEADIIMGFGCMDIGIPDECSRLFKESYGKKIIFSGNVGKGTKGVLKTTEAERFEKIALNKGVSKKDILLEKQATNTYENYKLSKMLLENNNYDFKSVIIVHKPYVKRRCLAIADIELPEKKYYITSQDLSFDEFIEKTRIDGTMSIDDVINEIVGEISIILKAPKYKVQSVQPIDEDIFEAYHFLINAGYTKHVITDEKLQSIVDKLIKFEKLPKYEECNYEK